MKKYAFFLIMLFAVAVIVPAVHSQSVSYAETTETLLNQDPDPAEPGEYLELRWKVQKEGNGLLEDIKYSLDLDYPFYFDSSDKPDKNLGDWKGISTNDEFFVLYYKILVDPNAIEDTYTIHLKKSTNNGVWVTEEFDVRVGEKLKPSFVLGSVSTSPIKLVSNIDEAQIDVDIENIGDGDAENVRAELLLPDGFTPSYSYSDESTLGTIASGSGETATFYVDIGENVMGGEYPTVIRLKYKEADDEDNTYRTLDIPFNIQVMNKPTFEIVDVKTTPENIKPGDEVSLAITIKNIGGEEGKSISLRAYKESSQPFDFDEKSDFIGNLKPGEEGEAVLKLTVDSTAALKSYLLDLEIRSITGEEVLLEDEKISMIVDGAQEKQSSSGWVLPLVLAIIFTAIGLLLGRYIKKK